MTIKHKQRMQKQKEIVDKGIAAATREQGVVIVLTGNGKGKTSSAIGMLARSLGHGHRCALVQFIKGQWQCGENRLFADNPLVDFVLMKTDFTWETQDYEADKAAAARVWEEGQKFLCEPKYQLVIFDEISYMFKFRYLEEPEFIDKLQQRPPMQSVILTGRGMSQRLCAIADTVSVIRAEKHAFQQGIKAQKGIEW